MPRVRSVRTAMGEDVGHALEDAIVDYLAIKTIYAGDSAHGAPGGTNKKLLIGSSFKADTLERVGAFWCTYHSSTPCGSYRNLARQDFCQAKQLCVNPCFGFSFLIA